MSKQYSKGTLKSVARQVPAPVLSNRAERVFGLHPLLLGFTIGAYFAFLGIMAATFMNPALAIPFVIFVVYLMMAFGVPGLWAHVRGTDTGRLQSWSEFRDEGIDLETGHIGSAGAIAQIVTLPLLIVAWALSIAIIVLVI